MAVGQRERKTYRDENYGGRVFPLLLWCVWVVMAMLTMWSGGWEVQAAPLMTTNETMVVSKTLLFGPCIDGAGNEVGDQAEWSTACNSITCFARPSGNYTVTKGCRTLVPSENPDDTNCITVSNSSAPYPDCCPSLQCSGSSGLSTVNPSLCLDIQSNATCHIWKDLSSNCTDTTSFVYNFTTIYCQATCGFCSGGSG